MVTVTFNPNTSTQSHQWDPGPTWLGGFVPNAADAVLPENTRRAGGDFESTVAIAVLVRSLSISANTLDLYGALTVTGPLAQTRTGNLVQLVLSNGTLSVEVRCRPAILTTAAGSQAETYVSNTSAVTVQANAHFTL